MGIAKFQDRSGLGLILCFSQPIVRWCWGKEAISYLRLGHHPSPLPSPPSGLGPTPGALEMPAHTCFPHVSSPPGW